MEKTLPEIIKQNKDLHNILLAQGGGIMKYLAEHLDANGIAALFTDYQDHCVDMFFERKKWDMQKVWSSDEMRRAALGVTEHLFRELSYWATLKPILAGIPTETFDIIETFVEQYLSYAYKKNQQRFHPGGMTPMVVYREVIELYSPSGLAYKCMKIILTEHDPNGVQNPLDPDILTEFLIREYSNQFIIGTLGTFELMRQAVAEMLEGKTQDECRQMAIDTMKRVRGFSQMIYTNAVVEDMREKGYIMEADQRERIGEWLRDVTPKTLFDEYVKKPKHHSLIWYNALYLDLLNDVGRIWAAQLLVHGIDMKDLESGVCCILNPNNTYRYYVDKYYSDDLPTQYCVSDEERAKELLKRIGRKLTQKCYLKPADDVNDSDVKQKLYRAYEILREEGFLDERRTNLTTFTEVLTNNSYKKIFWMNDPTHKYLKELICVLLGLSKNYSYSAILASNEKGKHWTFVEQHFVDEKGNSINIKSNTTKLGKKDISRFERILKVIFFYIQPVSKSNKP